MSLFSTLLLILIQAPADPAAELDAPLPSPEGVRIEYFLIESTAPSAEGPDGVVQLSSTPSPHGPIREREVRFREGPIHLREVESPGPGRPQAIWRERGPTWGRSWLAIWDEGLGALETTHWGPSKEIHGLLALPQRPVMGLELLERCRHEWIDGESFECLDPLAGKVVELEVAMRELAPAEVDELLASLGVETAVPGAAAAPADAAPTAHDGEPSRLVEWRRCDGTLAGRYLFEGEVLVGFQWQEGSSWAQGVDRRAHEEARASWFSPLPDRTDILEASLESLRQRSLQGAESGARKASARIR